MLRICLAISLIFCSVNAQPLHKRLVLDHVNIAVKDLPAAVSFFEETLGFAIKPGRLHENSIENAHVKFKDGSSLELITATEAKDALAKFYLERVQKYPEGSAAFICLRITDAGAVDSLLNLFPLIKSDFGYADLYSFKPDDPRYPLFFIRYKKPVKDDPKYLYHWNGAERLSQVTVCKNWWDEYFQGFGMEGIVSQPKLKIQQIFFADTVGSISLMPQKQGNKECEANPIIGVSILVEDEVKTAGYLKQKGVETLSVERGTVFIRFSGQTR